MNASGREWALACVGMVAIVAIVALVVSLSPGPVEAHIGRLVPRAAKHASGVFETQTADEGTRYRVVPDAQAYVGIVRLEAGGAVAAVAPLEGRLTRVEAKTERVFDGPAAMDDARYVAVFCPKPTSMARVVEAARAAIVKADGNVADVGPLELPCAQQFLPQR